MTRNTGLLIKRRSTLLGAAGLAVAPLAAPHIARAADPIKIGLLLAKTGQIAGQTEYLANGSFLALEQRNKTIMGQPAELVWLDEPSPQGAAQNMQKLVQENKVCAVLGGALSSNALAEEAKAARAEDPVRLRQRRGDRHHRQELQPLHLPPEHAGRRAARMLAPYALKYGKKWYHITASYAFGQDILQELARAPEGRRRHRSRRRRGAAQHRRLQLLHPEDPPGQARRRGRRPVGRRPHHLPEAVERARHEGQDPVRRDRDRRHRHLGRRPRGRERHLHQAVGRLQSQQHAGGKGVRRRPT